MRKTIVFEDLGEVVSITTDLKESKSLGFSVFSDEYEFSEKHVLKTSEGVYYNRTYYRDESGKEWWGDPRLISLEDFPDPCCSVRTCFDCRARFICQLEEEDGT